MGGGKKTKCLGFFRSDIRLMILKNLIDADISVISSKLSLKRDVAKSNVTKLG